MPFNSINPFNNKVLQTYNCLELPSLYSIIEDSHHAYKQWSRSKLQDRINAIIKFRNQLDTEQETLAQLITLETAKPIKQSRAELVKCIYSCDYFIEHIERYLQAEKVHEHAFIQFDSLGVILGIMPWNYPVWQVIRFAIPTLLAGNTVIIKHAPSTPQCSLFIEKIFSKIDLPFKIYQQIFIEVDQVETIISHSKIKGISITGSTEAGKSVALLASKYLKKYVLELGGSDPFIVCKDVDIDYVVSLAIESRCRNNGQSCIAAKRFIIEDDIVDLFIEKLKKELNLLVYKNPENDEAFITSLARTDLKQIVENQITYIQSKGYNLIYQYDADILSEQTVFPMIFKCDESSKLEKLQEELFAPIFLIYTFNHLDEAILIANNTDYGLGASVFTINELDAKYLSSHLECGMVYINEMTSSEASLPFGGIKNSGVGKELGLMGCREFCNTKLVYLNYK